MVPDRDHLLHNHVHLPSEFDAASGGEGRQVQLALHVETVHEGQELLRGVVILVLPLVRFPQVGKDFSTTDCPYVIYTHGYLVESIRVHPIEPMTTV